MMIQAPPRSPHRPADYVNLSFCGYAFWWFIILSVHLTTCAYNAGYAKFYWDFDATFLSYSLEDYGVGMPRQYFHTISFVHMALAAAHGVSIFLMCVGPLWHRVLLFSPWLNIVSGRRNSNKMPTKDLSKAMSKGSRNHALEVNDRGHTSTNRQSALRRAVVRLQQSANTLYIKIAHRQGVLGVNGSHFHTILIGREVLETSLQTVQAVRMSKYLPHPLLNRFYTSLLVINCWSSVVIYSRWFWQDEAHRRFALIICDCALDLMSVVGVFIIVVLGYVNAYNLRLDGFDFALLQDDQWVAQMLNEAQIVLVVSWSDLAIRIVFSLGIMLTATTMKELLRYVPGRNQVVHSSVQVLSLTNCLASVDPLAADRLRKEPQNLFSDVKGLIKPLMTPGSRIKVQQLLDETRGLTRAKLTVFHVIHIAFVTWGVIVLVLHMHAETKAPLLECNPKVYPMAGALPSCSVVNFNCHTLGIYATKEEVQAEWDRFDRGTAVKLHILHCSALEVPESFRDFDRLQEIHVYNSTIVDWGADAAVTNKDHARLTTMSLARVSMMNGLLPLGFQSQDFPLNLREVYFCETNLREMPTDLDSKWHAGSSVFIENSQLTVVPPALVWLQPFYLILSGNPIAHVPPELFEIDGMLYLSLSRTNILELPQFVAQPTTNPGFIDVSSTGISSFWSWIDPQVESMMAMSPMLLAGGSSYCLDLDDIMSQVSVNFSSPLQLGYSPLLMNATESNWELLRLSVDCSPPWSTYFPLESWDALYGLVDENDETAAITVEVGQDDAVVGEGTP